MVGRLGHLVVHVVGRLGRLVVHVVGHLEHLVLFPSPSLCPYALIGPGSGTRLPGAAFLPFSPLFPRLPS